MPILLRTIQRANPQDREKDKKFYPVQNSVNLVSEDSVAKEIAKETTLNYMEAQMSLRLACDVIKSHLLNGESVRLGDWGTFHVTLKTTGEDKKENVSVRNIQNVKIVFSPGKELKKDMQNATFSWLDK